MRKKIALLLFSILVILSGLEIFGIFRVLQSPERVQSVLIEQVQNRLEVHFSFDQFQIKLLPFPAIQSTRLKFEPMNLRIPSITAESAEFYFHFFPLMWGKVELSGLAVHGASGNFSGIPLQGVDFKLTGMHPGKFSPCELKVKGRKGHEILKGHGKLIFGKKNEEFWKGLGMNGNVIIQSFLTNEEFDAGFLKKLSPVLQSSQWNGNLFLEKRPGSDGVEGLLKFQANQLRSEKAGIFSLIGESKLFFNPDHIELKQTSLTTPFGKVDGGVIFNFETQEIKESRLIGQNIVLQELIRFFPNLNDLLPVDMGISGKSEFDVSLRGALDYLSLHANWNLTPSVITYGPFFAKPKDFPMSINFDFLLKTRATLQGDFSTRIGEMTVKGVLKGLDLKTGNGELTLLTNKFGLKDGSKLLPRLANYQMSGAAKFLLSSNGNLMQMNRSENMWNLSLDDVSILSLTGHGIKNANGHFDVSPLSLKIKDASFILGSTPFQIEAEIFNFRNQDRRGEIQINSHQALPFDWSAHLTALRFIPEIRKILPRWRQAEKRTTPFIPKGVGLENLFFILQISQNEWTLKDFEFQTLNGNVHLQGSLNLSPENRKFEIQTQANQLSLARYFQAMGKKNEILEGNFFLDGKFEAEGWKPGEFSKALNGKGTLSITNGEWHSLNLMGTINGIEGFSSLAAGVPSTPFHDVKSTWAYQAGRFNTEDFLLYSDDFWIEGKGNLSLDGNLNARLDVYFSKRLTEKIFKVWRAPHESNGKQLGPIPLLLLGNFTKPEVRVDDRSLEPVLETIRARRFRKVLREPFKN